MRKDDGRKLDHRTLEALRLRAVEQVARDVPAAQVGAGLAALGLHRRTIYTWLATERTAGREALRARPVPGRPRKLSDEQLSELAALITETDPRDHGFAVALWTREIVRQLIAARFGVQLTVARVGRTLHDLGFSAQRAVRAEHDLGDQRPGCAAVLHPGRLAPRRRVHRLPAAAAARRRRPRWRAGVCHRRQHPVHRATAVDRFVDSTDGALRLYRLPAYSPQLNPDEWVWKNVKHDGVAPAAPKGPEQMKAVVTARLRRLQRLPQIVRGFFADPELAYITAA